jgi:hypothetical protein
MTLGKGSLLASLVALVLSLAASPAFATLLVSVNKTAQTMSVALNGRPLWTWPVSTGRTGHDTPGGRYTPFRLEAEHYSKEWDDAPMPHSIFFTREGHAIHGTLDERHLGRRASHGCVRISQRNAARLFELVQAHGLGNTRVVVFSDKPPVAPALVAERTAPVPLAPEFTAPAQPGFTLAPAPVFGAEPGFAR